MVEERPQGLLGLVFVEAGTERDEIAPRDVGGERDRQPVLGLPRVDRHEVDLVEATPGCGEASAEEFAFIGAERPGQVPALVESVTERQVRMLPAHGDPFEPVAPPDLRGPAPVVAQPEADAAVVRDENGVTLGHRRFDRLEVRVGEARGSGSPALTRLGEFEGPACQGRRDLLEIR